MAGNLQPLNATFPIVDENGNPTLYFIKWAQQRQIDITNGITATQAQQLITDFTEAHQLMAGLGISITPDGNLENNPTISLDAVFDDLQDVDMATTPPTDGQIPVWDNAGQLWKPGDQGGASGGRVLVSDQILVSAMASVTFSPIPTIYKDLNFIVEGRSTDVADTALYMQFNGDTGNNYHYYVENRFGTAAAGPTDMIRCGSLSKNSVTANIFSPNQIYIANYADTTRYKNSQGRGFYWSSNFEDRTTGVWAITSAISSVTFISGTGNLDIGTRIQVYAIP